MNNPDDETRRRRRNVWAALLGTAFFLLFIGFANANSEPSLFNGANASSLQNSPFASNTSQRSNGASAAGTGSNTSGTSGSGAIGVAGAVGAVGAVGALSSNDVHATAVVRSTQAAAAARSTQATATAAAGSTQATATAAAGSTQATATATAVEAPLTVQFVKGGNAATTAKSYQGPVSITIVGKGQAFSQRFSDAFYVFTDQQGNNVTPKRTPAFALLCINGKPTDQFVQPIPVYSASHRYTVSLKAPGGPLTFGVCDSNTTDNTGSFTITFN